jgi:ABC-2 type transport system permease protein
MVGRLYHLPAEEAGRRAQVVLERSWSWPTPLSNLFVVLLMTIVGYLVGFRFQAGVIYAVLGIGLAVLVGFAFSWISAAIGLAIKNLESVQAASFIWIFPLTFASGAFVGIALMPGWLQVWARNNPVTIWSNPIRAYTIGGRFSAYIGETMLGLTITSGIWIAIILAIFMPLSVRIYRRT